MYPYWPRAFTLELATFYICKNTWTYKDFNSYKQKLMNYTNISDIERNEAFWEWVKDFPSILHQVMDSHDFKTYLKWEELWINQQNILWKEELIDVQNILDACKEHYNSPISNMTIILNPIKCAYSSDYVRMESDLYFILGSFRIESIIHEYLHHVVHQYIPKYKSDILYFSSRISDIDSSYFLDGDDNGKLNAYEEFIVCKLTKDICKMDFPLNLDDYIKDTFLHM